MAPAINPAAVRSAIRKENLKNLRHKGFTLIELLVVLFIIAIMSSAVVLGVSYFSKQGAVKNLSEKLYQILPLAREYAVLNSVTLKLEIEERRYAFYQLERKGLGTEQVWRLMMAPDFLKPQKFSSAVLVVLKGYSINGGELVENSEQQPVIEIFPTMEVTPFLLSIGTESEPDQYQLSADRNGVIGLNRLR